GLRSLSHCPERCPAWHPACIANPAVARLDWRDRRTEMGVMGIRTTITNERGVALPMALITLVLLTTLMLAFAVLSQTEPVIAATQLRSSEARAVAEGGFELAVWALSNALDPKGLSSPLPATMPTTFDGTTF